VSDAIGARKSTNTCGKEHYNGWEIP